MLPGAGVEEKIDYKVAWEHFGVMKMFDSLIVVLVGMSTTGLNSPILPLECVLFMYLNAIA